MELISHIRCWRNFLGASKALGRFDWSEAPIGNCAWKKDYVNSFILTLKELPVSREAKWIVDIGANIGLFSKAAALYCPKATIVAVEPSRKAMESLAENVQNHPRIQKIHAAVGATEGKVTLNIAKHLASSTLVTPTKACEEAYGSGSELTGETEEVRVMTLPGLLDEFKIDKVDLLKIDVEGYEPEVLKGADAILQTKVSRIIVELSIARLSFEQAFAQMQSIINHGYTLVNIVDVNRSGFMEGSPVTHFDAWFLRDQ